MDSNEIRYFSMFTGVGGFEIGLNNSNKLTNEESGQTEPNEDVPMREREIISKVSWGTSWIGDINEKGRSVLSTRSNGMRKFNCVGMSEWDKYSSQVLKYRFPNIKNWGDCTKIKPEDLPDFDLLCGGFPCQAFSIAGKRGGFEDTRGTMFFEVARILKVKRPKIILLENVKGLLNHDKGQTFRVILQTLDELGYETQWMVLNSKFFGVPQNRERVLIIGNLRGERRSEILPFGEVSQQTTGNRESQNAGTICAQYAKNPTDGSYIKVEGMLTEDGWDKRHENIRRVYSTDGISPTIPTGQGGGVMPKIAAMRSFPRNESRKENPEQERHQQLEINKEDTTNTLSSVQKDNLIVDDIKIRRLTPIECERLQGFQDNWTEYGIDDKGVKVKMSDTQRYKQMGNAVTTNVIAAVGSQILNNIKVEE